MTDLRGKRLRIEYRNGGSNEKRDSLYEGMKDNPLLTSNGSAFEAPSARMDAEEDEQPAQLTKTPSIKPSEAPPA